MTYRNGQFVRVINYYRKRYKAMEENGQSPYRFTALGAWAASRAPHVFHFFRSIHLDQYRSFVDLGSGDGLVACLAGLFTRSIGIEIDPELCREAHLAAAHLGMERQVEFICSDYLSQNLVSADCLYIYPDKPFYALEKMLADWKGTLLVYGPHFPPKHLTPIQHLECGNERIVLYRNFLT
ncbi:hypothetical protein [Desulforhabdus amnigena]|jgi:hypothetical protein|uniref:Class I SAM-dependent methyltransferase n=1 Tax=Desulforhabdus amnigena TaxID=40218 RepID=A0A9W6CVT3_9BACT|nr:hypothetical protein [Desulforhabdus amnigena]NLJ28442.1 hypothetical protein [Deltaproteobacteria bacterium]GLI33464.1 hypothetical protein DAMNIGENAA_08970 [Desulforhabdus amnigena]